ncbi:MAG: hypothetical protein IKE90_02000 [Bacilli bacterium]|nr:hypothetical protein [Bacilli bacterium]
MKLKIKALSILLIGIITSLALPHFIISLTSQKLNQEIATAQLQTVSNQVEKEEKKDTAVPVQKKEEIAEPEIAEEVKEEPQSEPEQPKPKEQPVVEIAQADPVIPYDQMTNEQLINSIANGTYKLEYTTSYETNTSKLTKSRGALYYNNHKETYYSQRVLPGTSLNIPGRHVADDGTIRDGDGYICVAANSSYLSKGTVVKTSVGPAKVYDYCPTVGTVDIYTNW